MSWLFGTGFDLYTVTANQVWSSWGGTINSGNSRWPTGLGGNLVNGGVSSKVLASNEGTLIIGFAFKTDAAAILQEILYFIDGSTAQCTLVNTTTGQLALYRGTSSGTQLAATGAGYIVTNVWHYIEVKIVFSNTGSYEIRVDGNSTPILSGSADTTNTANNYCNQIRFAGISPAASTYLDDIYLINTTGPPNNDFLGDTRIEGLVPTGAGAHTDWTPSTGSNWQNVDDIPPNDDTDYNSTSTLNNIDTYAHQSLTTLSGTVRCVQHFIRARKDDAGTRKVSPVFRISGTDYVGSEDTLSTSYQTFVQVYETSPATSAAWALSAVNAAEIGVKLTT